ncbi:MAG: HAMP domain-containing protein [Deltaproteobacteria bacterium]|nr:HAMP domain-containing protein [Deltaproteobacteria bacterium]
MKINIKKNTLQGKIILPFVTLSFLAIIVVVLFVGEILTHRMEESTTKEIISYRDTIESFFRDKEKQAILYAELLADERRIMEKYGEKRIMGLFHLGLFMQEGLKIYIEPFRYLKEGNTSQKDLIKKGLSGELTLGFIPKQLGDTVNLDFDVVAPVNRDKIIMVGFGFDDEYLKRIKKKIGNDIFILYGERVVSSTLRTEDERLEIQKKATPDLIERVTKKGESVIERLFFEKKEYKVIFAPLEREGGGKAIFGIVMSTNDLVLAKKRIIANYIAISLLIMAVLSLINYIVVKRSLRPLKRLSVMANRVARGDLSQRVDIESPDEIGIVATSFNNMVESLIREEEKLNLTIKQMIRQEKFASIGEIAAGIAHEIGNSLAIIVAYSKLLLNRGYDEDARECLKYIMDAATRMDRITKSLLMYAKPSYQQEILYINRVIEESISVVLFQYERDDTPCRIEKSLGENLPPVMGNKGELHQVFINLFINSVQAMPHGGTISVSTEHIDKDIVIKVIDTGEGIPQENRERIFDPFFTTKTKGTGLGLSITQRIIENHKGEIMVCSDIGKGTTFIIRLPTVQGS